MKNVITNLEDSVTFKVHVNGKGFSYTCVNYAPKHLTIGNLIKKLLDIKKSEKGNIKLTNLPNHLEELNIEIELEF